MFSPRGLERCTRCKLVADRVPRQLGDDRHHRCGGRVVSVDLNDDERQRLDDLVQRRRLRLPFDEYPVGFRARRWSS